MAEYDILIEVFVWFWYILKHENGKRRKLGIAPDILIEVFVRFVGAHLDDDVSLVVLSQYRNYVLRHKMT